VYVLACEPKQDLIFTRRFRLTRREGFSQILKQRANSNLWFAIHSQPNMVGCARLGVSVSKRITPSAVGRNSVKRLIRECFRLQVRQGAGRDVVIRLRKPLDKQDRAKARAVLSDMIRFTLAVK